MGFAKEVSDVIAFIENGSVVELDKPEIIFDTSEVTNPRLEKFLGRVTKY